MSRGATWAQWSEAQGRASGERRVVGVGGDPGRRASRQVWPRVCGGLWGAGAEGAWQPREGHGLLPRRLFGVLKRPVQSCCFRGHCGCWVQAHWRDLGAGLGRGRDRQGWRWVRARWAPALWGPVWAQWGIASALPGLCPLAARVHLPGLAACPRTLSSIPGGRGPPARGGGMGTSG